jgi:hypothetical protein
MGTNCGRVMVLLLALLWSKISDLELIVLTQRISPMSMGHYTFLPIMALMGTNCGRVMALLLALSWSKESSLTRPTISDTVGESNHLIIQA